MTKPHRLPGWLAGSGIIAVSMAVMNVGTYGFTLAAARILGPREYGPLAATMGLLLVLTVVSLGLQATGARRVSVSPDRLRSTEAEVLSTSYRAAVGLGALTLLATPAVTVLLRLDSWLVVVLLALSTVPLTVMGACAGILQGERRWGSLAAVYLGAGLGRFGFGVAGTLWSQDVVGAMAGVAAGNAVPALLGWWVVRRPWQRAGRRPAPGPPVLLRRPDGSVLVEVAQNSHALLAFFALSNTDVVLARVVLDDQQGGLYAGGLIMAKAVLFLPQFVVVIAFPAMVGGARRRLQTQALGLVMAIGGLATAGAWLLAPLAVLFVGGSAYRELESEIWAFAAVGTLMAMIQLVVYGTVAHQHRGAVGVLWAGLIALVGLGLLASSLTELLLAVVVTDAAVLVALILASARHASVLNDDTAEVSH